MYKDARDQITLKIPKDLKERLDRQAALRVVSRNIIAIKAIEQMLDKLEKNEEEWV